MKSFRVHIKEDVDVVTKTKLPDIYLDMDETIVDWLGGANKALRDAGHPEWNDEYWSQKYSEDEADKIRWSVINAVPTFWEDLEFMPDGRRIWNFVKKYKPKILSACGTLSGNCKKGKLRWLAKHLGMKNLSDVHLVRRSQKKDYAKDDSGSPTVLIDDFAKNCLEYRSAGGLAIQATNGNDVINKLKRLGFR